MIPFQYQVLRYQPDRISAEFVNVGIVVFSTKARFVRAQFIESITRVSGFFYGIDTHHIRPALKHIEKQVERRHKELGENRLFQEYKSIDQLVYSILPKDDSALYFADPLSGLTVDIETEFEKLSERLLFAYNEGHEQKEFQNDKEVWSKLYLRYFKEAGIDEKLKSHFVKTSLEQLEFPFAYKNDIYHCFETHNFNLSSTEAIKHKAQRIAGRLMELSSAKEAVEVNILSVLPSDRADVTEYLKKKLHNQIFGESVIKIISPDEAKKIVAKAKKEIEAHEEE